MGRLLKFNHLHAQEVLTETPLETQLHQVTLFIDTFANEEDTPEPPHGREIMESNKTSKGVPMQYNSAKNSTDNSTDGDDGGDGDYDDDGGRWGQISPICLSSLISCPDWYWGDGWYWGGGGYRGGRYGGYGRGGRGGGGGGGLVGGGRGGGLVGGGRGGGLVGGGRGGGGFGGGGRGGGGGGGHSRGL